MSANRGRDTGPETAVRSAVHRRGMRFRVDTRPEPSLRRTADLVFRRAKVAVFVDGCFWHSCPIHRTRPRANGGFWSAKLERTIARDRETTEALEAAGWLVLRFWEHEDPEEVADRIRDAVLSRR
ncbi:MAG: very short patch repair endonuclease [Microthrixaceae bacterium]|nr:very short patch repair endonuclease [Microthrixaceae bacterium]